MICYMSIVVLSSYINEIFIIIILSPKCDTPFLKLYNKVFNVPKLRIANLNNRCGRGG
jgi:hypothetical protein